MSTIWSEKQIYRGEVVATVRCDAPVINLGRTSVLDDVAALVDQVAVLRVSLAVSCSSVAAPLDTQTRSQQVEKKSKDEPGAPDLWLPKGKGHQLDPPPIPHLPTTTDSD